MSRPQRLRLGYGTNGLTDLHLDDALGIGLWLAKDAARAAFAQPRFLHQTRTLTPGGLRGTDDLGEALAGDALPDGAPWRAHFHVPLHAPPAPPLTSTLHVLQEALVPLVGGAQPRTRHPEVETYTWQAPARTAAPHQDPVRRRHRRRTDPRPRPAHRPRPEGVAMSTRPTPLLVLDVVGLTPRLLDHMPGSRRWRHPVRGRPCRPCPRRHLQSDDEGPLVLVSTPRAVSGRVAATEVKSLLLRLAGLS